MRLAGRALRCVRLRDFDRGLSGVRECLPQLRRGLQSGLSQSPSFLLCLGGPQREVGSSVFRTAALRYARVPPSIAFTTDAELLQSHYAYQAIGSRFGLQLE